MEENNEKTDNNEENNIEYYSDAPAPEFWLQ